MNNHLIYIIKVNLILGILYGIFRIFFYKTTFHVLNRFLLLFIIPFSLLCPILEINNSLNNQLIHYSLWIDDFQELPYEDIAFISTQTQAKSIPFNEVLLCVYLFGLSIFLIRFMRVLYNIIHIKRYSNKISEHNFTFILMDSNYAPFSFFHWIFLPAKFTEMAGNQSIIEHEKVHSKQMHSLDLIVTEVFLIIFWFNPFVFLLKQSLKLIHEYLADREAIKKEASPQDYLKLLFSSTQLNCLTGITNPFKCITIKNRIVMITKNKTWKLYRLGYLLIIPILIMSSMAFSKINPNDSGQPAKTENIPNICPIKEKNLIKISSRWGMRKHPITKEMKMHKGIDLVAKTGTPVIATADGVVTKMEFTEGKGYGRLVCIQHSDIYSTCYAQLSDFKVQVGQKVKQGDLIGLVGSSGYSTGPHLHYEVWKNGERVDPEEYFE